MPKESFLPSPRKPCTWRLVGGRSGVVVSSRLSTMTPGVTIHDHYATYPTLPARGTAVSNAPHFTLTIDPKDLKPAEEPRRTFLVSPYLGTIIRGRKARPSGFFRVGLQPYAAHAYRWRRVPSRHRFLDLQDR